MRVAAIVFLFLIRLQFPKSKSISDILCRRYGQRTLEYKEHKNLKNLIIVYAKLTWILNFYYGVQTAMSYLIFFNFRISIQSLKASLSISSMSIEVITGRDSS